MSTHFPSTVRQLRQETLSIHLPRWSSRYQTLVRRLPSYWELFAVAEANNLSLANADSALLTRLEQLEGIVSRHGLEPIIAEAASTKETRRSQTPARMQLHSQQGIEMAAPKGAHRTHLLWLRLLLSPLSRQLVDPKERLPVSSSQMMTIF